MLYGFAEDAGAGRNSATIASTTRVSASGVSVPTSDVMRSLLAVKSFPGLT